MRATKEETLIATYASMTEIEIERRLASGNLTSLAAKIARAELENRRTLGGQNQQVTQPAHHEVAIEHKTPFEMVLLYTALGVFAFFLFPESRILLFGIALCAIAPVIGKLFPIIGSFIGAVLLAGPIWIGGLMFSGPRHLDGLELFVAPVFYVCFSAFAVRLGMGFIKGSEQAGARSELPNEPEEERRINKTYCPSCRGPMFQQAFAHRMQGVVELDLCFACHGIWFDESESPQIAPGGVIDLFRLIHAHRDDPRQTLRDTLSCPHCDNHLLHARDRVKGGAFNYYRCPQRHGRFTAFAQFMIEKGFVRQLNDREIKELEARVGTISCSSCGAPLDIRQDAACSHCRSPITILDPDAVENALASYSQAEVRRVEPDRAAQLDALAEVVMASDKLESALRRAGTRRSLARPNPTHIDNETDVVSRLFGD